MMCFGQVPKSKQAAHMPDSIREPENLDFSLSPLPIPARFQYVRYNGACYPGAEGVVGLDGGANCQLFAYELLPPRPGAPTLRSTSAAAWPSTFLSAPAPP
jgi:hypothetical protein